MIGYAQLRAIQWDESGYSTIGVNAVSPYCNAQIARYRAAYAIFGFKIIGLYFSGVLDVFACFTSSAVLTVLLGFPRGQAVGLERYSHAIFLPEKLCLVEVSNLHLQRIDVKVGRELSSAGIPPSGHHTGPGRLHKRTHHPNLQTS